jgi:O-antigen ligase
MTLFWCQYLPFGIYDLFIYLSLYIIFLLGVSLIQEEKQLLPIAWTWVIMACIYSIIKPIIPAGGSDATQVMGQGPSTSLFSDKNNISSLINMSLFMLMAIFILDKKGSHRLFLVLAAILMLNVDYIFGSRGGLVSLGFGVLLFMLVLNRRRKKWKKFALTAITVITIVALIIIIPVVPLLFYKLGETVQIDLSSIQVGGASGVSLDFRFDQWGYASHMLNDKGNHLTGLGLAGYKSLYSEYYNPDITPIATNNPMLYAHPHSYWVYTYTDMGIIGMIILHIFFIVFIWNMRKFLLTTENLTLIVFGTTIFCGVITYWVHGVVEFSYTESNRMWLFIGMGSALILINEREKQLTSVRAPERLEEGVPV